MSFNKGNAVPKALSAGATPTKDRDATRMIAGSLSMLHLGETGKKTVDDTALDKKDIYHRDESGVDIKTTPTGKYTTKKANDNPERKMSPGTQYGSFVQHGIESRDDDPFTSVYQPPQRRQVKSSPINETPTKQRMDPRFQQNWRSGSGNGSIHSKSPTVSHGPSNRNSPRALHQDNRATISNENAQAYLPPGACLFVANLSSLHDDNELQAGLLETFNPYGLPWVKIRRDGKNMPYAFVQFETENQALNAIAQAKGRPICGRPCRVERAKAHRTFFIARRDGTPLLIEDGEAVLKRHGVEINCSWYPDEHTKLLHGLAGGFFVQLKFWDDARQAQTAIRNEDIYQFEQTNNIFESPVPSRAPRNPAANERAVQYINQCEQDRNSIFVSNLPEGHTEADFRELFNEFGVITSAVLFHRPSQRHPDQIYTYGFVEYQDPFSARRAIDAKNGTSVGDSLVKVAQKTSNRYVAGGSNLTRISPHRTPQVVRQVEASSQTFPQSPYPPTPYGWMGFSPPAPYPTYWGQPTPYMASPYPGTYGGTPSPHPSPFYPGYNYPVDMYGSYYGVPYWAPPATNAETPSSTESPATASTDNTEGVVEEQPVDTP